MNHYKKRESPGGLPVHTGWMADGMWVAITLNDFGQVHLMRDEPDQANAYLYAVLNHATPFYSWCEERGQFPGAKQISGDLQHLWTPEAVVRFMRDMLVMEQDNVLHLGRGIARGWLGSGEEVGHRARFDPFRGPFVPDALRQKKGGNRRTDRFSDRRRTGTNRSPLPVARWDEGRQMFGRRPAPGWFGFPDRGGPRSGRFRGEGQIAAVRNQTGQPENVFGEALDPK